MSTTRCACPSCHHPFGVPDDIVGKQARCPFCGARLTVKAIGGKTTLALAGVNGDAPTQALPETPRAQSAGQTTERIGETAVRVASPPAKAKRSLLPWLLGGTGSLVLMCCGGIGGVGVWWGLQPAGKGNSEKMVESAAPAEDKRERRPQGDPDREAFAQFVRANAQDPSDLEIIQWGERRQNGRDVRFRCKLIGITPAGTFFPGVREKGGDPVLMDDAQIEYAPDGKISRVHLNRCRCFWNAPSR